MPAVPDLTVKQREAFRLANDLTLDLTTGFTVYHTFQIIFTQGQAQVPEHVKTSVTRLCLFHVIISLAKWTELYDHYKDVIPPDVRQVAKELRQDVVGRGIVDFRNKVVGHVRDDDKRRPLTNDEIDERLHAITTSGVKDFLQWAGDPDAPAPNRPVLVIEKVREAIRAAYALTDADLHR